MKLTINLDEAEIHKAILAYIATRGMKGKSVSLSSHERDRGQGRYYTASVSEVEIEEPNRK